MLSKEDMMQLYTMLEATYKPIIERRIEEAVREIPWTIRKHIEEIERSEIRALVRQVIEDKINVQVEVKDNAL